MEDPPNFDGSAAQCLAQPLLSKAAHADGPFDLEGIHQQAHMGIAQFRHAPRCRTAEFIWREILATPSSVQKHQRAVVVDEMFGKELVRAAKAFRKQPPKSPPANLRPWTFEAQNRFGRMLSGRLADFSLHAQPVAHRSDLPKWDPRLRHAEWSGIHPQKQDPPRIRRVTPQILRVRFHGIAQRIVNIRHRRGESELTQIASQSFGGFDQDVCEVCHADGLQKSAEQRTCVLSKHEFAAKLRAMAIQSLFPTLIYSARLQNANWRRFNNELLRECYQVRDHDRAGQQWSKKSYPGGYTSYGSLCQMQKMSSTFMELERKLNRHVKAFAKSLDLDLEGRPLAMTDCWINIMPHQVVHGLHLHPLSTISGTYYVKTPAGCPGIKFEDPRLDRFMAAPPRKADCRPEHRAWQTVKAEAGNIVLFESWMRHEVPPNPLVAERVSISFNYSWF